MRKFIVLLSLLLIILTGCVKTNPELSENPESSNTVSESLKVSSVSEGDFMNAVSVAGYLDRTTFANRYSDTDKDMLEKMHKDNIFGVFYESRPFNINEIEGLEQYRFLNISEPSDWDIDKYLWESGDFASFFSFSDNEYSRKFVESFVNDIKQFSPNTDLEHTVLADNAEKYVSSEKSASGSIVMTHCIYRLDNTVLYIECLEQNHAMTIPDCLLK